MQKDQKIDNMDCKTWRAVLEDFVLFRVPDPFDTVL